MCKVLVVHKTGFSSIPTIINILKKERIIESSNEVKTVGTNMSPTFASKLRFEKNIPIVLYYRVNCRMLPLYAKSMKIHTSNECRHITFNIQGLNTSLDGMSIFFNAMFIEEIPLFIKKEIVPVSIGFY